MLWPLPPRLCLLAAAAHRFAAAALISPRVLPAYPLRGERRSDGSLVAALVVKFLNSSVVRLGRAHRARTHGLAPLAEELQLALALAPMVGETHGFAPLAEEREIALALAPMVGEMLWSG